MEAHTTAAGSADLSSGMGLQQGPESTAAQDHFPSHTSAVPSYLMSDR